MVSWPDPISLLRRLVGLPGSSRGYAMAALSVLLTTLVLLMLDRWIGLEFAFFPYVLVIMVCAARWGPRPALLAILLAAGFAAFFFAEPRQSLLIASPSGAITLLIFIVVGFVTAALTADHVHMHGQTQRTLDALKESQAQLVQAGKLAAIGTLASGVAHELNQPLMVIRGQAQIQLERTLDERQRRAWQRVERQTGKMMQIIDHLRAFGRPAPDGQPVPLNQVVEEALLLIGAQLREHDISLRLALFHPDPIVLANANEIEQILLNLLVNARDALDQGGEIVVRTGRRQAHAYLSVADSGPGIPDHVFPRLFEPFFTTKEVGKGTGLGLPLSRDIARRWGGDLTVENQTDGGTIATLTLPLVDLEELKAAIGQGA